MNNQVYGRMTRLSQQIAKDQEYKVKVIFSNAKGSLCRPLAQKSYLIKFGRKMIDRDSEIGYLEYPNSYTWLWPSQNKMTGLKAAYALVIHELAHTIQVTNGKRKRGSQHNSYWASVVQMLQTNYPFSDFEKAL